MTESARSAATFVPRPTLTASVLGLFLAAVSIGLIADADVQRRILVIGLTGVGVFAIGGRVWKLGRPVVGVVVALCGGVIWVVAMGDAATLPPRFVHRLELLPGLAGLWILATALVPLRFRWSRALIDLGSGLVFLSVLTSGIVQGATTMTLVIAAAATIIAWDAAEHAVSTGGQTGARRVTATARAELVHVGGSVVVAASAVALVLGVERLGIDGLPFAALVALLVAGVSLLLVYHR